MIMKNTLKKLTFAFFLLIVSQFYSIAQDAPNKVRELGINMSSLNSFGIRYKTGNSKTLLRITLLALNGYNYKAKPDTLAPNQNSFGGSLHIGFERRKTITDKVTFYYGLEALGSYTGGTVQYINASNAYSEKITTSSPLIGAAVVLGFNYNINSNLLLAAEILPGVNYNFQQTNYSYSKNINSTYAPKNEKYNINGLSYNLIGANVTLAYRFNK
jgi:hypothetical protein